MDSFMSSKVKGFCMILQSLLVLQPLLSGQASAEGDLAEIPNELEETVVNL